MRSKNKVQTPFQTFNDGICSIYAQVNEAKPGNKPVMQLQLTAARVPFEKRRVGINRFYDAKQDKVEIERLIRIPEQFKVSTQDICMIDNVPYGIYQVQDVPYTMPKAKDLSLKRWEEKYELRTV